MKCKVCEEEFLQGFWNWTMGFMPMICDDCQNIIYQKQREQKVEAFLKQNPQPVPEAKTK